MATTRGAFLSHDGVDLIDGSDRFVFGGTTPAATCLYLGGGNSTTYLSTSTANSKFMEFRLANSATSGDNRGMYLRLQHTGAGGGGEALRVFTNCQNVACGTAHGGHISLSFGATGSITGLGVAMRGTLHVPNAAMSGGTYSSVMAEIWHDGASSDISGTTKHSNLRLVNGGNATGAANHTTWIEIVGTNATNFPTGAGGGTAKLLRCVIDGTLYYLKCYPATS